VHLIAKLLQIKLQINWRITLNLVEAKVHFIGIGGIGMSGIAEVLTNMGCTVSGSDLLNNAQVERLSALGVQIKEGHSKGNLPKDCDVVVYSSAVNLKNPELLEAYARKIPVIQRAEMLSELMRLKRGIAIGGTHGKTTTTSMTAAVLLHAGLDPTIVVGGRLDLIKSTAALGKGHWLLAEADESDASFLRLSPEIVVATNIDNDHLDHYKSFENLVSAFHEFLTRVPFYGLAIVCGEDPHLMGLIKNFPKRVMSYGFNQESRLRASDLVNRAFEQEFKVSLDDKLLGSIKLKVPGKHNALNALAAVAVGLELKIEFSVIQKGLESFCGVDRRLQVWGSYKQALFIDDYGHHPTEVRATISALKTSYPDKKLTVVFQPHRFSRTQSCWNDFLSCFNEADRVFLLDIYSAGEKPIPGITSIKLAENLKSQKKSDAQSLEVKFFDQKEALIKELDGMVAGSDVILTLGAGDVWKISAHFFPEG
jgi:UDP-N-acetylmuramate--alanine ligase